MSNTYDTHDLTMLRASLELAHDASLAEIAEEARRIRLDLVEAAAIGRLMEGALGIDALGLYGHERLPDVMRRIERLREAERIAGERLSLLQQIAHALSPAEHPSPEKLLDLAQDAAQAVLDGDRGGARWTRAPIDHLRVAARLDEALTDMEVIEHAAAALERWREAAEARPDPTPTDPPPMVVGWREDSTGWTLVRVEGDDETTLYHLSQQAAGGWTITAACHDAGDAGWISSVSLPPRLVDVARASVLALVRAANPDRRVILEAPCAP